MRPLGLFATVLLLSGCYPTSPSGEECGGGQYAEAHAILPDTGINAGDTVSVGFVQHDMNELSELVVWHLPATVFDSEPDPRVRIVRDDGRVLLDSIGSRYSQPENRYNRPTWFVHMWIRDAGLRNAFYGGFRDETLWVELWHARATQPGTRVRMKTDRAGVQEKAWCV